MNLTYTTFENEINVKSINDPVKIWFFSDVHRDTESCDVDRWHRFLKDASKDKDAYFFGVGDYHDFASTSEKAKMKAAKLHETTLDLFDELAQKHNRDFCKEIGFMRGRLLGLVEGNHYWELLNGKTTTEDLSERMETPYLGWLCHYTLKIHIPGSTVVAVHIVLCHGKAGGKSYGITVNQVADLKPIFPCADIYVMGHDHRRWAYPDSVLIPIKGNSGYKVKQKSQLLCRSGSFKKSYEPEKAGYEAGKLLKPANLGALKVMININRIRNKEEDRTYSELTALV